MCQSVGGRVQSCMAEYPEYLLLLLLLLLSEHLYSALSFKKNLPLTCAASTADGTWCTVYGSGTAPDDCSKHSVVSIDFIPLLICCKVFSVLSQHDSSSRTICSRRTVAVHSREPRSRAA